MTGRGKVKHVSFDEMRRLATEDLERARRKSFRNLGIFFVGAAFFSVVGLATHGWDKQWMLIASAVLWWSAVLVNIALIRSIDDRVEMVRQAFALEDWNGTLDALRLLNAIPIDWHVLFRLLGRDPKRLYRAIHRNMQK